MKIIIFGGTGSIGSALTEKLSSQEEVTVFSNSENEIWELKNRLKNPLIRYIQGDVRDIGRVSKASEGMDVAINCAALKHVDLCENAINDTVMTNYGGLVNIMDANERVIQISTDKAVEPTCVMGATKFLAERYCIAKGGIVVRLGNVYGSRGSLVPIISRLIANGGVINITDFRMKRYFITLKKVVQFIISCITRDPGKIYIPIMKERLVIDLINDVVDKEAPKGKYIKIIETGIRKGEKLREKLYLEGEDVVII